MRRVQTTAVSPSDARRAATASAGAPAAAARLGGSWQTYAAHRLRFARRARLHRGILGGAAAAAVDRDAQLDADRREPTHLQPGDFRGEPGRGPQHHADQTGRRGPARGCGAGIASADVHVRLPNQVLIDVREHLPLVAWQGITTTVWLSAEWCGGAPGRRSPVAAPDRSVRHSLSESRPTWDAILPQLAEFQRRSAGSDGALYGKFEGLYFRTPEGWTVWLGNEGIVAKLACLKPPGARSRRAASDLR